MKDLRLSNSVPPFFTSEFDRVLNIPLAGKYVLIARRKSTHLICFLNVFAEFIFS